MVEDTLKITHSQPLPWVGCLFPDHAAHGPILGRTALSELFSQLCALFEHVRNASENLEWISKVSKSHLQPAAIPTYQDHM